MPITRVLLLATAILAFGPCSAARSQVTIDVAKITCDQFMLFKVADPDYIALWLNGYYHGKRDTTLIDTQALKGAIEKLKSYCRVKPEVTVMQAGDELFGLRK